MPLKSGSGSRTAELEKNKYCPPVFIMGADFLGDQVLLRETVPQTGLENEEDDEFDEEAVAMNVPTTPRGKMSPRGESESSHLSEGAEERSEKKGKATKRKSRKESKGDETKREPKSPRKADKDKTASPREKGKEQVPKAKGDKYVPEGGESSLMHRVGLRPFLATSER